MTAAASGGCGADHGANAGLQDAGLFAGDRRDCVAEEGLVVERDRGDRGHRRARDHVGRVEPAAEPGLEQHDIGRDAREGEEGRRRGDLEIGDRRALIGPLALLQHVEQRVLVDQPSGQPDPLVKAHEMRRGVDMGAVAGGFGAGAHRRDGRTLAVGAGDMDDRRQMVLRIAERRQQPLDPAERQVDLLRMQLHQPRQHPVARGLKIGHRHSASRRSVARAGTAAAAPASARCGSRSSDKMRARVACRSPRRTT